MSQREKMEETFSPSHDMTEYVNNYWKWRSYLGNKTLVERLLGEQDFSRGVSSY